MKSVSKIDVFLISLGLATLVVQRFVLPAQHTDSRQTVSTTTSRELRASAQPTKPQAPEWELTFPEGSEYQDLTPPKGVAPNPFLEVQRISREHGRTLDYAAKDTDMRQLLLAHQGKDYLFVLQQQAANEMLRQELFRHYYTDPTDHNMLAAIAFYTQQLEEARSEDAKLVYMCLRALKDYWPQERLAKVALSTAARVKARAEKTTVDTTSAPGYYRQIYARELQKMGSRLQRRA
ncbi:hypothetical protein [Rufibacter psychrotolerans]|uniref:hypothetical protein n=1 Tax=Rufibacter psychrotolerans TaxID=2812556 RepID=UPI001967D413|nr:hypothetical protein [Rufibacter sp. SYSU D00308]